VSGSLDDGKELLVCQAAFTTFIHIHIQYAECPKEMPNITLYTRPNTTTTLISQHKSKSTIFSSVPVVSYFPRNPYVSTDGNALCPSFPSPSFPSLSFSFNPSLQPHTQNKTRHTPNLYFHPLNPAHGSPADAPLPLLPPCCCCCWLLLGSLA
jgi:hypothetical protein